jgi:CheY-like chemotaxis protein
MTFKKSDRFDLEAPKFINTQPSYSTMNGFKVLIAEDNLVNTMVLKRLFDKWQVNYVVAENGAEAVRKFDQQDFDLILMDIQMPVMDGYRATQMIRSKKDPKHQNIPIIALTASAEVSIQREAKEVGMDDFMSKPFNPVKLYNKLKEYMVKVGQNPPTVGPQNKNKAIPSKIES